MVTRVLTPLLHKILNSLKAGTLSHLSLEVSCLTGGLALSGLHVFLQITPPVSWAPGTAV